MYICARSPLTGLVFACAGIRANLRGRVRDTTCHDDGVQTVLLSL
jgi:hypothetical protein